MGHPLLFITHFSGWDAQPGESDLITLLRALVISELASLGEETVVSESLKRFANREAVPLPADLRLPIFSSVIEQKIVIWFDILKGCCQRFRGIRGYFEYLSDG